MANQSPFNNRYQVIPRTLIFIFNKSEVLLIKQNSNKKIGFGKWNGVGGHIENGEDPFFAARREIREETGLAINDLVLKFITIIPESNDPGICLFIFSGNSKVRAIMDSPEGQLAWMNLDQLNNYPLMLDLSRILELIISQSPKSGPQILSYSIDIKGLKIDIVD